MSGPRGVDVDRSLRIRRIEALVYRYRLDQPVRTSFGTMQDRPCLLVRLEDRHGLHGFGEVWCNWPACGAEHRAALLVEDLAEIVLDMAFGDPMALFERLTESTAVKVLQTGEPGPYAEAIAGLDIAAWDLWARMAGNLSPPCSLCIMTGRLAPMPAASTAGWQNRRCLPPVPRALPTSK